MNTAKSNSSIFVVKRIASAVILLIGLATVTFMIVHLAPGDPVTSLISPTIPISVAKVLRSQFGLDQSLLQQYIHWMQNALSGNFGISFSHHRPVADVIRSVLPNTCILAGAAMTLELVLGLFFGYLSARYNFSLLDKTISHFSLVLYTLPTFWIGLILLTLFSYWLGMFPSSQMYTLGAEGLQFPNSIVDLLKHLALPAMTIAIPGAASIMKYFRSNMLKVRGEEYIAFARSYGIPSRKLFFFYELPNTISPVISILGLEIGTLLAGTLVTETLFAWPGMGRLAVMAIVSRDYPLIMGCTLISGMFVIAGNLAADVLYSIVDPRVKISA